MFTFGEHVKELIGMFPDLSPNDADSITWQAVKDVFGDHTWSFAIGQGWIQTEASYDTGTIEVTNGSTAVTLTGGTWSVGWTLRRIIIESRSEDYGITITGATTGTLDHAWAGEDDATATYQMFRDVYSLPADCDESQVVVILDPAQGRAIPMKDFGIFMRRKIEGGFSGPGTVEIATPIAMTSAGVPQIRFGPCPPSSVEVYQVYYFRSPTRPTQASSLVIPAFPQKYEDLIDKRAAWAVSTHPRYKADDGGSQAAGYERAYWDRYFEAISHFDGGDAMRRIIVGTVPSMTGEAWDYYTNFTVRM